MVTLQLKTAARWRRKMMQLQESSTVPPPHPNPYTNIPTLFLVLMCVRLCVCVWCPFTRNVAIVYLPKELVKTRQYYEVCVCVCVQSSSTLLETHEQIKHCTVHLCSAAKYEPHYRHLSPLCVCVCVYYCGNWIAQIL